MCRTLTIVCAHLAALLRCPSLIDSITKQKADFKALLEATKPRLKRADAINQLEWAMLMVLSRANTSPDRAATSQLLAESQRVLFLKSFGAMSDADPSLACTTRLWRRTQTSSWPSSEAKMQRQKQRQVGR